MECTQNSLTTSATGMSPFKCVYSCQPQLFPKLDHNTVCSSALALAGEPASATLRCPIRRNALSVNQQ